MRSKDSELRIHDIMGREWLVLEESTGHISRNEVLVVEHNVEK
jgi:hypothetical protein